MSGIKSVCVLHARCPYCARSLDLRDVIDATFRRLLKKLRDGQRIQINKFGTFRVSTIEPRRLEFKVEGKPYKMSARRVIRFRASPRAKKYLNERMQENAHL